MAKELYLYSAIWSYTAESIISQLNESSREDVVLRMMSPGGGVLAGWGIAAKMKEKKQGNITIKVDGGVASMSSVLLFYAQKVMALSVSNIMLHRASGPIESPEDKALLDKVNLDLRAAMEKKLNSAKLKELKNISIADIFELEPRPDVYLTAQEAKQIGLVDEIFDLNSGEIEALSQFSNQFKIAAEEKIQNPHTMTLEELQAKHPDVFAKISQIAATKEKKRIQAWVHFAAVDAEAVKKGIESGEEITNLEIIELMEKKKNVTALADLKDETKGNKGGETAADPDKLKAEKEKAEKEKAEFMSNVNAGTGVKIFE